MESIFKRSLKNKTTVPIADLFVVWEGKLQGLDHKRQVMSAFLGPEMNILRQPKEATEECGSEHSEGQVTCYHEENPEGSTW